MRTWLRFLPTGSIILTLLTFGSYALGLIRDRIFARTFGASAELDAYNAAFLFPDLIFNILIASGIAAAFVPIITHLLKSNRKRAEEYLGTVMTSSLGAMALSAILIFIFAETLSDLVAPGFSVENKNLVASLLRILSLSPLFFALSNALGSLLIVQKRFFFYGLSPLLYNIGIIGGAIFLSPTYGIMGVAYGTLIGALLHLLARLYDVISSGFVLRVSFFPKRKEFKETLTLMVPKMFGHPVELATFWMFTVFASTLETGSISVLNFARNFMSVPISLIGITIATTTFPVLALASAEKNKTHFREKLLISFWLILIGSTFAALILYLVREPLISLLLGGGAFDASMVSRTALVLGMFVLAIPTEALTHLLARSFYSLKNTLVPVILNLLGLAIAFIAVQMLIGGWGIVALPFAFFLGSAAKLILLIILLPTYIKKLDTTTKSNEASS
jgi:putative peptidoglycan lipid II flippase